jgi:hypothetical protein
MMKPRHVPKVAAIFPSVLVALVHFRLSVLVGPSANVVFQRWFDTGESASGTDSVIASVEKFLSMPIPALFFAAHPVYGMARGWWVATIINSVLWGLAIYASYVLAAWLLNKLRSAPIS